MTAQGKRLDKLEAEIQQLKGGGTLGGGVVVPSPEPPAPRPSEGRRRSPRRRAPAPAPEPAAKVADAKPRGIEAGWGDMAKRDDYFTVFVTGRGFDAANDRIVVIHGEDTCGSASARIATVNGYGDKPSGIDGWASLKCDGLTSGSTKLACGDGASNGVKFPDDKWVDTYIFKVCVCDYSKNGKCSTLSDFDTTPVDPDLAIQPVI